MKPEISTDYIKFLFKINLDLKVSLKKNWLKAKNVERDAQITNVGEMLKLLSETVASEANEFTRMADSDSPTAPPQNAHALTHTFTYTLPHTLIYTYIHLFTHSHTHTYTLDK